MVESTEKQMTFDDLIKNAEVSQSQYLIILFKRTKLKEIQDAGTRFMGYQDEEAKNQDVNEIRARQQSCYIKDLPEDERPEFWKATENKTSNRMTIKQIVHLVRKFQINEVG